MWVRGQEGYAGGKGHMQWRLWGAVQLTKQEGAHLDQSALVRYLAGAVLRFCCSGVLVAAFGVMHGSVSLAAATSGEAGLPAAVCARAWMLAGSWGCDTARTGVGWQFAAVLKSRPGRGVE
jgi:hypothetical protein